MTSADVFDLAMREGAEAVTELREAIGALHHTRDARVAIERAHRMAHSLRGLGHMVGGRFVALAEPAELMEAATARLLEQPGRLSEDTLDVLAVGAEMLDDMMTAVVQERNPEGPPTGLLDRLASVASRTERSAPSMRRSPSSCSRPKRKK